MQVEQALNENSSNLENVYISGIDSTVTEMEIAELFRYTTQGETQVKFYENNINNRTRIITEVQLQKEKAVMAHSKLNGQKIKDCVMKLIPQSCMKQLILTNLPIVFSEKDMYLILNSRTEGLKSITIADDPQELGKTQQVLVAVYKTYEMAQKALPALNGSDIMGRKVECFWKDPEEDIILELSLQTRCILIKNLSFQTSQQGVQQALKDFGKINRIIYYVNKCFVEFDSIEASKKAYYTLNKKRVDGKVWEILPAKKENLEAQRDGIEKNLKYSIEFFGNQQDKDSLISMGRTGQLPPIDPIVQQKANQIIQQIKQTQRNQLDMLKMQIENQKNINANNFQGFNGNNNGQNNNKNQKQNQNQNQNQMGANALNTNENSNPNINNGFGMNVNNNNNIQNNFNNNQMQNQNVQQQNQIQNQNQANFGNNNNSNGFNNVNNNNSNGFGNQANNNNQNANGFGNAAAQNGFGAANNNNQVPQQQQQAGFGFGGNQQQQV